ncbi:MULTISPECIES: hypothetical protein [Nocardia]|uniref:Low molecular weight antigen MTB12-like C-terminal domain-containing protein n=1 Tax=Nocardia sputorum TaxID=2984338 RepID=A0ABM8D549_9NOCA|nr:hypothetical protein [Nocardia sputorum]BDU02524.1 hypothetical protein IFM12276_55520 [Nocardia sputorum]
MTTPNKALARLAATAVALTAALVGAAGTVAPAVAAPLVAPLHARAPGAGELTAKLRVAINTGAARSTRAAELESGDAGVATMDKIAGLLAISPPSLRYNVINPSTSGDRIDAQLLITTEGYPDFTYDVSWKQIDGYWKLTRQAECSLASALALSC